MYISVDGNMNISADNNMYIPVDENPGIFGDAPFKAENETWGKMFQSLFVHQALLFIIISHVSTFRRKF